MINAMSMPNETISIRTLIISIGAAFTVNAFIRSRVEQIVASAAMMHEVDYEMKMVGEAVKGRSHWY
jgi:hypothetical protein